MAAQTAFRFQWPLRIVCALLGLQSVASLLAWVFRITAFETAFLALSLPAMLALGAIGIWLGRRHPGSDAYAAMVSGALGGLCGTIAYDAFRAPFNVVGLRLLAP